MVKKSKKKEQRVLAQTLAQKRRLSKPAKGKMENNSFSHVKDKIMRSELTDRTKRVKKKTKGEIRKGRRDVESKLNSLLNQNPGPESINNSERKQELEEKLLEYPTRKIPNTIESLREADETVIKVVDDDDGGALDEEIEGEENVDEFGDSYFNTDGSGSLVPPKIMITTSIRPSKGVFNLLKELVNVIPNTHYYKRKGVKSLKQIIEYAKTKDFTMLMVFTEKAKVPNGVYLCSLPDGPTSFWKLTKLKLGQEMKGGATCSADYEPELLLNNFTTRLGRRVARQLASLVPQKPNFNGRRSITFHNQRDFVFFRHYRYQFQKNGTRVGLAEIGPRFTLKLRYLQHGCFDSKEGEYEYQWRPDSQVSRKKMFL